MITDKEKIELERDFIGLLLKHKDLVGDWIENGPSYSFFDTCHHVILNSITYAYNHDFLLTLRSFRTHLSDKIGNKLEILAYEKEYNLANMSYVKRDDYYTIKGKIAESYIAKNSIAAIEKFRKDVQDKGTIFAVKQLNSNISNLITDTDTKRPTIYQGLDEYMPEFIKILEDRKDGKGVEIIRCGIKEIDQAMVVGFAPGTLTLFCGDVASYKTTMMLNIGLNVWGISKKNVLFVPLEMPRDKIAERFISRETQIPFAKFEDPHLLVTEDWEKIRQFEKDRKEWSHKFFILDAPERIPVSLIRREIEKHIDIFKPNLIIVDYIANLISDSRFDNKRSDEQIGEMLKDLRHMGRPNSVSKEGFAIVSAAQIGREGLKRVRKMGSAKGTFYSEDLRGSHEYSADADNIFGQMEDPSQPSAQLQLVVIKARYGPKTFSDGSTKATLSIKPEIALIRSKDDVWLASEAEQKKIMDKVGVADTEIDSDWDVDIAKNDFDAKSELGF